MHLMGTTIHPTAVIAPQAELDAEVHVGPYAVIETGVEIGAGSVIGAHAVIHRYVRMGRRNRVHAHAVLGDLPQDVSFQGAKTEVVIGDDNVIREGATIHRATQPAHPTRLGSRCYVMVNAHIGHDCTVEDEVILTNNVTLGGHVQVGYRAVLGGFVPVHQFVRVGPLAMVAGHLALRKDVLPFGLVGGAPVRHHGLNRVGLKRAGIQGARYRVLEQAYRLLRTRQSLEALQQTPELEVLKQWLAVSSRRGIYRFLQPSKRSVEFNAL